MCFEKCPKKVLSKHWKSTATTTVWISAFFKISSFCYTEESFIGLNDSRGIDDDRCIIFGWKNDLIWVCLLFHQVTLIKILVCHFLSIHRRLRVSLRKKHHVCLNDLLLIWLPLLLIITLLSSFFVERKIITLLFFKCVFT